MANKDAKVKISFLADEKALVDALNRIEGKLGDLEKSSKTAASALSFQSLQQAIGILTQFADKLEEVATRGTSFALLQDEFNKLTAGVNQNGNNIIDSLEKTSRGAISERDLILSTNKSILLNVADTSDELNDLLQVAINRANKLGISATQAFDNIVTGLGRESPLILDNLGIIIKLEYATEKYAKTLNKSVGDLTAVERKQALVNEVLSTSRKYLTDNASEAEMNSAKVQSLSASWANLADTLSAMVSPTLADVADKIAGVFNAVNDKAKTETQQQLENVIKGLQELDPARLVGTDNVKFQLFGPGTDAAIVDATKLLTEFGETNLTVGQAIDVLNHQLNIEKGIVTSTSESIQQWGMDSIDAADNAASLERATKRVTAENEFFQEKLRLSQTQLYSLASASAFAANSLTDLSAKMQSISLANSAFEAGIQGITNQIIAGAKQAQQTVGTEAAKALGVEALEKLNQQAKDLKPNLESGNLSVLDLALTFGQVEGDLLSPFKSIEEQNRLAQQQIKQTGKETTKLAHEAEQAFNQLQSQVSSVLSSALSGDIGINLDDILPRQDALNENARRLADIAVKGFDSPWYEYFKKEFPALFAEFFSGASTNEGVKLQAANVIKNFQDGLQPELIDKEAAKDLVRRALIGQQNMADLANEIASELSAELGTSLQSTQNLARSVLGGSSGEAVKLPAVKLSPESLAGIPDQFEKGFSESFSGFSETFATNLFGTLSAKVVVESSATAGRLNGSSWGSGFMETVGESVPTGLIDLLTLKVLPNVEGALKQSENRSAPR